MLRDRPLSTAPAFAGSLEPAAFFVAAPQEEALARLEWLVAAGQRCGIVVGDAGLGKSHLAAAAARRLGGLGAEVAVLSLRGLPDGEWLDLLLERLPLDRASRADDVRPWIKLENRLRENALMERATALVFDDLDEAPADARDGIARLVAAGEPRFARTLVVATTTLAGLRSVPDAVRQRAAVRIELGPWTTDEVASFLAAELTRSGWPADGFSPEAIATLTRFAGGVPRTVTVLARLALVAATGDGADRVDAATVERAWRELCPSCGAGAEASSPLDDAAPAPAPVRAVRRLWG